MGQKSPKVRKKLQRGFGKNNLIIQKIAGKMLASVSRRKMFRLYDFLALTVPVICALCFSTLSFICTR
jgi:hypothetical protein